MAKSRRVLAQAASLGVHAAVMAAVASWTPKPARLVAATSTRSISVFAVPPADASAAPGLNPLDGADDGPIPPLTGSATVSLPGFVFDAAKIERRAALLFPFLAPGLSLEHFAIDPSRHLRDGFRDPFAPVSDASPRTGRPAPPLALTDAALQALVDRTWSRRDRWTPFQQIVKLADTHNADAGRLPALLHEYQAQNGLQPYVDTSARDPRMWTELGLAADHVEFIGFISRFAAEHPKTKATTELIFLLDKLAQASLDALITLLDTVPEERLVWTHDANPQAYELIVELRHHYSALIARKRLASTADLIAHYDRVRLGLLSGIIQTTPHGYRVNDARFLIGGIYWRHQNVGDALRTWRAMTIDAGDAYAWSIRRILDAIAAQTGGDRADVDTRQASRLLAANINEILRAEHGRWIMFSMDRLRQFGFHFDTF